MEYRPDYSDKNFIGTRSIFACILYFILACFNYFLAFGVVTTPHQNIIDLAEGDFLYLIK